MNQAAWETTLNQLQLQMPRGTFENWLQDTKVLDATNGTWYISAKNDQAKDWLENRLYDTIARTLHGVIDKEVYLDFVVTQPSAAPATEETNPERAALVETINHEDLISFDVYDAGYNNHAHYIQRFWGAFLGADALQIWSYIRSYYIEPRYVYDRQQKGWVTNPNWDVWTPQRQYRPADLARCLKSKSNSDPYRRKITGGWKSCHKFKAAHDAGDTWTSCRHCSAHAGQLTETGPSSAYPDGRPTCRYWTSGILELLKNTGICRYEKTGDPEKPRTIFYKISIFQSLPLLTPIQAATMNEETQQVHREWLARHGINIPAWERETAENFVPELAENE